MSCLTESVRRRRTGTRGEAGGGQQAVAALRGQGGENLLFEGRVEQQNGQLAIAIEQGMNQAPSQGLPRGFDQRDDGLVDGRGLEQGFENGAQIADGDPFAQQLFENAAHFAQGEQLGHQLFHQLGMALVERVHETFGLGPAEQLPGMLANQFAEMGGDDRDRVDHRIAGGDGLVFESRSNPDGGNAEGRLTGFLAGQRTAVRVAGDGQQVARLRSASGRSPCRAARTGTRAA